MSSKTAGQVIEREVTGTKAGARPFTGVAAWWDKVDGFSASVIVAASMGITAFLIGVIVNFIFR